jgi:RNA-directed DNA polymerase
LALHPEKTKIVYCKLANRPVDYPICQFDFLGYTFRPRSVMNRTGKLTVGFTPAVSNKAAKAMRQELRRTWLWRRSDGSGANRKAGCERSYMQDTLSS